MVFRKIRLPPSFESPKKFPRHLVQLLVIKNIIPNADMKMHCAIGMYCIGISSGFFVITLLIFFYAVTNWLGGGEGGHASFLAGSCKKGTKQPALDLCLFT